MDISQQISDIEETLRKTPHHKATDHFIGKMRAKIAHLKDKELFQGSKGGGGGGFSVKKQGDATIVLVGPPSAGKSTLLNRLTNADSKVAPYAFTTVTVIPGMLRYKEAYIQILDIPGLIEGARSGKGRGKEVLSVARNADLLLIMTDTERVELLDKMVTELEAAGIRVNKEPPNVLIEKKTDGGIEIRSNFKQDIASETIKEIAFEFGIRNANITLKEKISLERLIDAFSQNRVYIPAVFAVNKIDLEKETKNKYIGISAEKGIGIDRLIEEIWRTLKFLTVELTYGTIIMKHGDKLKDVAEKIGAQFAEKVTSAKIWGGPARFPGQEVSLSTPVSDNLKVEFL